MDSFGFDGFFFQFTVCTVGSAGFEFNGFGAEFVRRHDFAARDTKFGRGTFHRNAGTYDHEFAVF